MVGIIMTGYASVEAALQAFHARAFTFLEKPLDMRKVAAVVDEALKEQEETIEARRLLLAARAREGVRSERREKAHESGEPGSP